MVSSLAKYKKESPNILKQAFMSYRSYKKMTLVVEGHNDKIFISQWLKDINSLKFAGFDGKDLVEDSYKYFNDSKIYREAEPFIYFMADIDYDFVLKRNLIKHNCFIYNSYCDDENLLFFNDLEAFLSNTSALDKLLLNLKIPFDRINLIKASIYEITHFFGSLRAADQILNNGTSILDGLNIEHGFIDQSNYSINSKLIKERVTTYSRRHYDYEDLESKATELRSNYTNWELNRGHDICQTLSILLEFEKSRRDKEAKFVIQKKPNDLELLLRTSCELTDFQKSSMARKMNKNKQILELIRN